MISMIYEFYYARAWKPLIAGWRQFVALIVTDDTRRTENRLRGLRKNRFITTKLSDTRQIVNLTP